MRGISVVGTRVLHILRLNKKHINVAQFYPTISQERAVLESEGGS